MPATYEPIATTTLGSAATEIDFTSIPSTYTDLRLIVTLKGANTGDAYLRINSDTGSNYSRTELYGDGTSAASSRGTNQSRIDLDQLGWVNNSVTLYQLDFFSYAGSTNKTILCNWSGDQNGSGGTQVTVGLWRSTSAITAIKFYSGTNYLAADTTATLYGILKA